MASDLITNCPHCGRETAAAETLFGSAVRCPSCFRDFVFESVTFGAAGRSSRNRPLVSATKAGGTFIGPLPNVSPSPASATAAAAKGDGSSNVRPNPESIGRFKLRERIGEGSFGLVLRAFDPVLDREVAIKVPRFPFVNEREHRRFVAEAKSAARLRHPGIVAVHEAGIADGRPYLATEFVKGQTLADRIKAGRPPIDVAVSWVRDLARALAYAHAEGVVHRDVKPGNVMLDSHDRPQLMDFGLARHLGTDSSLTAEGSLLGTPAYMSPEQARGEISSVGPWSDQYSLGVILYELLRGARPFSGPPHAVVSQVASEEDPPPLRNRERGVPRDLAAICHKAMEKDPRRRYEDAAAFADDLSRWLSGDETLARPLGPLERLRRFARRSPAVAVLTAAVVTTALIGFLAVFQQWRRAEENHRTAERHLAESQRRQKDNDRLLKEVQRQRDEVSQQRDAARDALAIADRERNAAERALAESIRQRTRADEEGERAARLSQMVAGEQAETDRQKAEAGRLAGRRDAERAQELAESDKVVAGFLLASKALASLPAGSDDLERHLRMNLALLQRSLHEPAWMIDVGRPIEALDVDSTGLLLATGDDQGTVRLWNAEQGIESFPSRAYDGPVHTIRFSPDARRLFVGAGKETAEIVEIAAPSGPVTPFRHPSAVLSAAFDGAGRKLATGGEDRRARVWVTATARLAFPPLDHEGVVRAVALNPRGTLLLTGTASLARRVTLWDATNGRQLAVLYDGTADVTAVAFDAEGEWLAAGTADGLVRFWRTADRAPSRLTLKVAGPIRSLAFGPPGRLFVAAGDGVARLWDIEAGQPDGQSLAHDGVTVVACAPTGQRLSTAGDDGIVRLWRNSGAKSNEGPVPHDATVSQVALRADGEVLAIGDEKGAVRFFDVTHGAFVGDPVPMAGSVSALEFHPDGRTVAVGAADGTARLLSGDTAKPTGLRMKHDGPVTSVAFSPRGDRLVTTERGGPARLWEAISGKAVGTPLTLDGGVEIARFSPDGSRVAIGGPGAIRFWSADGDPLSKPLPVAPRVVSLTFSHDGRTLLAGAEEGPVTRWNVENGRQLEPTFSHGGPLHTVAFGPDGRLVLTAGPDRNVRLWDAEAGMPFGSPLAQGDDVTTVRFRNDGRFLLIGTNAGEIVIADAILGRRIGLPFRIDGPIRDFAASHDDTVVAVAGGNTTRTWQVPPPVTIPSDRIIAWAEFVTGSAAGSGSDAPLSPEEWEERRLRIESIDERAATNEVP